jgi:regulator of cell morphogenesis and NO signaling
MCRHFDDPAPANGPSGLERGLRWAVSMQLDPTIPVAHLVARRPLSWGVLRRHGMAGHAGSLIDACASAGKEVPDVIAEIEAAERGVDTAIASTGVEGLVDHLDAYHRGLGRELARLGALARAAVGAAGVEASRVAALRSEIDLLAEQMALHCEKEQWILFPWLRSGRGATATAPVQAMEVEHDEAMRRLFELRRLCLDYLAPPGTGPVVAELWRGLERLESDLVRHIHTANNRLFPLALVG